MLSRLKRLLRSALNARGYDVTRYPTDPRRRMALYAELYPSESLAARRFYNVGAGGFAHPYWTNVDYQSDWYRKYRGNTDRGIHYDLLALAPLPVADSSAEIVFSSHTVEHITDAAARNLFQEAYRILKPGGFLRVVTPNIDLAYRAYREGDREYFYWIEEYSKPKMQRRLRHARPMNEASTAQVFLSHFASSVSTLHADGAPQRIGDEELCELFRTHSYEEALTLITARCPLEVQRRYPGNHINWWNFEKMEAMLREAGFTEVYRSGYGQSFCPVLRDLTQFDNRPRISLFVEAVR